MGDKAYQKNITISLGLISFQGDLWTVKQSNAGKEEQTKNICPACSDASPVKQYYECANDPNHSHFTASECDKGKMTLEGLVRLSSDVVKQARSSELPPNVLDLSVHKADDVLCKTIEHGSSYVIRVGSATSQLGVLRDLLVRRSDLVLMGQMNMRSQDKLFKLVPGLNGQLMLVELVWPADMDNYPTPEAEYKPELLDAAEKFADGLVKTFDPDEYTKAARARMAALTGESTQNVTAITSKANSDDDLMAALLAAVA